MKKMGELNFDVKLKRISNDSDVKFLSKLLVTFEERIINNEIPTLIKHEPRDIFSKVF